MTLTVEHLFVSPGHNFFGRHGHAAGAHPIVEVDAVECVAGHGIRGDRFFDYRSDYKGQLTVLAPDAEQWLKQRGGLRCRILSDGWLRRGAR